MWLGSMLGFWGGGQGELQAKLSFVTSLQVYFGLRC
jgi:hypothetical protein